MKGTIPRSDEMVFTFRRVGCRCRAATALTVQGQQRPSVTFGIMSAFPLKADLRCQSTHGRLVPKAAVSRCSKNPLSKVAYSITSSAIEITPAGMVRPSALAVVRLMTSSNLFGYCSTGSSAFLRVPSNRGRC